jgi:hypothetical protein
VVRFGCRSAGLLTRAYLSAILAMPWTDKRVSSSIAVENIGGETWSTRAGRLKPSTEPADVKGRLALLGRGTLYEHSIQGGTRDGSRRGKSSHRGH